MIVAVIFLLAALLPASLTAQADTRGSTKTKAVSTASQWHLAPGFHAGSPAVVSLTLGVARTLDRRSDGWRDVFIAVEPGLSAGRVSAGYAHFEGNLATGYTVRATALRRWKSSTDYAGLEASVQALFLGPRVGVFVPVRGDEGKRVMLTIDLGVGY